MSFICFSLYHLGFRQIEVKPFPKSKILSELDSCPVDGSTASHREPGCVRFPVGRAGSRSLQSGYSSTLSDLLRMSHLDPIALFTLGDFKNDLVKLLNRFPVIYLCEQSPEGVYVVQLDKQKNLVVDDKQALTISLGDLKASVKPTKDGGCLEVRFRTLEIDVFGTSGFATVSVPDGQGIVFKELQKVLMVFGASTPIETGMTTVLKGAISKVAKWRKGELTFRAN